MVRRFTAAGRREGDTSGHDTFVFDLDPVLRVEGQIGDRVIILRSKGLAQVRVRIVTVRVPVVEVTGVSRPVQQKLIVRTGGEMFSAIR